MTHTSGPWTLEKRMACYAIVDSVGQDLAYQDIEARFYNGEPCGSITSRGRTKDELQANACLIAASPELLEALQAFLRAPSIGSSGPGSLTIEVQEFNLRSARAAIAKATNTKGNQND